MVKNTKQIFGIDTNLIVSQGKRYRIGMFIGIGIDVLIMVLLILKVMFSAGESIGQAPVYFIVCIVAAIFANLAIATSIKDEVKEAHRFYQKYRKFKTETHRYKLDTNSFFSVIFCAGYQRVKPEMTLEVYKECMDNACCQNMKFSKKLMSFLVNYEDNDGDLEVTTIRKGKLLYYVNSVWVGDVTEEIENQEGKYDDSDERDA